MKRMIACTLAGLGLLMALPATADPGDRYRQGESGHHAGQYRSSGYDRGGRYRHEHRGDHRGGRYHDGRYGKRHHGKAHRGKVYHGKRHYRKGHYRIGHHRYVRGPRVVKRVYYPRPFYSSGVAIRVDNFYFGWRGY